MTILKGNALASKTVTITRGEFVVTDEQDVVFTTLLGSCVACCLWDPETRIGGMNHLLLAQAKIADAGKTTRAGVAEMECLINGIIRLGGQRASLQAKVFGGAEMGCGGAGIGGANARFVLEYLDAEGIGCANSAVGGTAARRVRFWPASGRVSVRNTQIIVDDQDDRDAQASTRPTGNAPELF